MSRRSVCCLAWIFGVAAGGGPAQAPPPDRWLHAVAVPDASPARRISLLQVDWAALAAADVNLAADTAIASDPRGRVRARGGVADLSLRYRRTRPHASVTASAFGRASGYENLRAIDAVDRGADVGVSGDLGRATRLTLSQSWRQQPLYQFTTTAPSVSSFMDPDGVQSGSSDARLSRSMSESLASGIALDRALSAKWRAHASYGYRFARLGAGTSAARSNTVNGGFTRALTRYAGLRLGYGYATTAGSFAAAGSPSTKAAATEVATHNLDMGVVYSRPVSPTRRTSFAFSSGATMTPAATGRTYALLLDASVARAIGRSWAATGNYHRGVTLLDGFATLAYADVATVALGGFATSRLAAGVVGARSRGRLGVGTSIPFTTDSGSADLRLRLNRRLALVSRYGVYHYVFQDAALLPPGLGRSSLRQSVRVGISGSLPNLLR